MNVPADGGATAGDKGAQPCALVRASCGNDVIRWRWIRIVLVVGLVVGVALDPPPTTAQPPNRAGLVIQLGDGSVRTYCIAFPEPTITGDALLRRSGLEVRADVSALGTTVCRIDETGCDHPREACWCRCRTLGAGCTYWGYNTLEDDRWSFSVLGAAARVVRDGDVDGWAWGQGAIVAGAAPPVMTFDELCASPPASPSIHPPALDPTANPPAGARRGRALPSPTGSAPTHNIAPAASKPADSFPTDASPNGPAPAAARPPAVPPSGLAPTDPAPPDTAPRHSAPRDHAPINERPARRPARGIGPTAPAGMTQPPAPPARTDGRAADRVALAAYVGLVVALAATGLWLRRAR